MDAHELANLAVSRARLRRGMSTADSCGDYEWVRNNRLAMMELDDKIEKALEILPPTVIEDARELTNAPI